MRDTGLRRNNLAGALIAGTIFAGLSALCAFASKGFLEEDAISHYLIARYALRDHRYADLLGVWGRPLVTCLYAMPAQFGAIGVRMLSLGLAMICLAITYRIAISQKFRYPALAVICLCAQPLFFLHSFSELTELPFATLLVLAFWAYQEEQWLVMAALAALLPLGRPEGFAFVPLAALALLYHKKKRWLWILPLPLIGWSLAGWILSDYPPIHWWMWLLKNWPWSQRSMYGSGPLYWFLVQLPMVTSPLIFPALGIGIWWMFKQGGHKKTRSHLDLCKFLIAIIPLAVLAGHTFLWFFGLQGSAGLLRYMAIASPFWALLCAQGWDWVFDRYRLGSPLLWAGLAAIAPALINLYWQVLPIPLYDADILGRDVAAWYCGDSDILRRYPKIMASLPSVYYALDISKSDAHRATEWGKASVLADQDGTVLVWDKEGGAFNSDEGMCVPEAMLKDPANGWVWQREFVHGKKICEIYLSRRDIHGKITARAER